MKVDKYDVVGDLLESNKKQFIIPVYQRNYEWNKIQCKKLFDDIIEAYEKKKKHFIGSIVYVELGEINKLHNYVIIDGQQRITTLYLLLKAMYDTCLDKDGYAKEEISDILFNKDKYNDLNLTSQTKLKLKPIKTDNQQLLLLMNDDVDNMNLTSHIYLNYLYFKSLINITLSTKDIRIKDILDGLKQLVAAVIALKEGDDDPQVVFESINSTGLDLSLSDLIRNYVLMTDKNQDFLFENYWLKLEENINSNLMDSYIIDYLMFRSREVVSQKNAYDVYKKYYVANKLTNELALKDLYQYSNYYKAFCVGDKKYSDLANKRLDGLRVLEQTTAYPFLFPIFNDYDNKVIGTEELEKVLSFLFGYLLRRIICGIPSNSLRGLFKNLYNRIFADESNKEHYYDAIVQFFMQISTKDRIPTDTEFINALMTTDLYHKKKTCKYLLKTLEDVNEDGTESKELVSIDKLTIEHIMPQTLNDEWEKELGENALMTHSQYLHTLGNLTLTGYNSELSDNSFKDKKKLLNDKNSHIVTLNKYFMNQEQWNETTIKERARILSDRIKKIFEIDAPKSNIEFNNASNLKISLISDFDVTGTKPTSYIFMGESENISYYSELLQSIFNKIYTFDSNTMISLAESDYRCPNGTRVYITKNKSILKKPMEILDSGIYIESNMSSSNIMSFIKNIFNIYGIDENDFVLFVKYDETNDKVIDDEELDDRVLARNKIANFIIDRLKYLSSRYDFEIVTKANKFIRFVPYEIRNKYGQVGEGWIPSNDLFVFEICNSLDYHITLSLYLGPTQDNKLRKYLYNYFKENGKIIKPKGKMNNKWDTLYSKTLFTIDNASDIVENNFGLLEKEVFDFFENDYPKIMYEFSKY